MFALLIALAAIAAAVCAALLWSVLRRRSSAAPVIPPSRPWTAAAGDEFAGLTEPARCEMAFALSALDDAQSLNALERALSDPSETVALAAAHALVRRGRRDRLASYFAAHSGARAQRLQQTLTLLG